MALRTRHGQAAKYSGPTEVLETLPVDELPAGVPAPAGAESPSDRREGGKFAPGNSIAQLGGRSRAGQTRLADRLGLQTMPTGAAFRPYRAAAVSFRRASTTEIARTVGGGVCGPIPSSFVASAALALGWSRFYFDAAASEVNPKLVELASKLAESSSSLLRQAHEYAAKEATARGARNANPHAALAAALATREGS